MTRLEQVRRKNTSFSLWPARQKKRWFTKTKSTNSQFDNERAATQMFDTFSDLGIEGCWCRAELTEGL